MARRICLGGTFNVIHDGHLALLKKAFEEGDEIYIGLTTDKMASRSRKVPLQDYETRLQNLNNVMGQMAGNKPFFVFSLDDPMGRAANGNFEAIVVSQETVRGAEKINEVRARNSLKPLEIIVIEMILAENGEPISASKIIRGQINPKGKLKQ
ncbi:MAG: pantetheine-phosphate adenylyltransferase [Thermoplasmata archaeon]|nr:pantetheine-phosphate adenylyltransferase [Thermoplasmata archaeon]